MSPVEVSNRYSTMSSLRSNLALSLELPSIRPSIFLKICRTNIPSFSACFERSLAAKFSRSCIVSLSNVFGFLTCSLRSKVRTKYASACTSSGDSFVSKRLSVCPRNSMLSLFHPLPRRTIPFIPCNCEFLVTRQGHTATSSPSG
jgi:hypothetical protein